MAISRYGWHPWILVPTWCPPSIFTNLSWAKSQNFFIMEKPKFTEIFVENMSLLYSVEVANLIKCSIFLWILIFALWKNAIYVLTEIIKRRTTVLQSFHLICHIFILLRINYAHNNHSNVGRFSFDTYIISNCCLLFIWLMEIFIYLIVFTIYINTVVHFGTWKKVWYQGGVKATVSGVYEDLKFKISEGSDQKWSCPDSALLAVSVYKYP